MLPSLMKNHSMTSLPEITPNSKEKHSLSTEPNPELNNLTEDQLEKIPVIPPAKPKNPDPETPEIPESTETTEIPEITENPEITEIPEKTEAPEKEDNSKRELDYPELMSPKKNPTLFSLET